MIIVSGASGFLGRHVCGYLASQKRDFVGLVKGGTPPHAPAALVADLSDAAAVERLAIDCGDRFSGDESVFIHCAGIAHQPNETDEVRRQMVAVNVHGTEQSVRFCMKMGISRFIYISSISPYKWSDEHEPIDESGPLAPTTRYAKSKLEGEAIVQSSPLDWRIVRLATVFGVGDTANFLTLARAIRAGRFIVPGKGEARKSVIPVDIASRIILELADLTEPKYRLINVALPEAPTLREIADSFSERCGFARAASLPKLVLRVLATAGSAINFARPFPLTVPALRKLTTSTFVRTDRLQEMLPKIPFRSFYSHLGDHSEHYRQL